MGISLPPDTAKARISRNVDKMASQGASDAEIESYLQSEGLRPQHGAPDAQDIAALQGSQFGKPRPGFRKDIRDMRAQAESTRVAPSPTTSNDDTPLAGRVAETLISGVPFAQRAVSGYRGLIALLGGAGLEGAANEVTTSLARERKDTAAMPAAARIPLQLTGGAPVAMMAAPLGLVGGGAALGAAQGLDRDASGIGDRLTNTALGAALGGAAAKGGQLLGRGAKNVADRTGLTDVVARAVDKVAPSMASAIGTRGQVNAAFQDRQDILNALGDQGRSAADVQLSRIATRKANAKVLYNAARQDTRVLADPELQQLLADPQVQKAYSAAAELRAASGNPLPRAAAPAQVPVALQKMGVSPERYAELQALGQSRSRVPVLNGTDILPPELMGPQSQGVEMPDPDVLAKVKRYLYDAAKGRQDSPLAINQDEARTLLPKVDAIRQKLHSLSPSWQRADEYYAAARGEEEAFAHGFDAFRVSKNPTGDQLATHSPEAMLASIETPRYPGEPPEALAARANAFRQGVRAAAAAQVKGAPVQAGAAAALKTKALAPTENVQATRALMFDQPDQARTLEQFLASLRGKNAASDVSAAEGSRVPRTFYGALRTAIDKARTAPDLLATSGGQSLIADRLGDPSLLADELRHASEGRQLSGLLQRYGGISLAGQVAR